MTDYVKVGEKLENSYALNSSFFLVSGNILSIIFNIVTWEDDVVCMDGDVVYYD